MFSNAYILETATGHVALFSIKCWLLHQTDQKTFHVIRSIKKKEYDTPYITKYPAKFEICCSFAGQYEESPKSKRPKSNNSSFSLRNLTVKMICVKSLFFNSMK